MILTTPCWEVDLTGERFRAGPQLAVEAWICRPDLLRVVDHGRVHVVRGANAVPTEAYWPRCGYRPLLWSEVSDRDEHDSDHTPFVSTADYPTSYEVALDVDTGICVAVHAQGGTPVSPEHEVEIIPVDEGLLHQATPLPFESARTRLPKDGQRTARRFAPSEGGKTVPARQFVSAHGDQERSPPLKGATHEPFETALARLLRERVEDGAGAPPQGTGKKTALARLLRER